MIGVVIPAHNEEAFIENCLRSVLIASRHPSLNGEEVKVLAVLDSCTDRTAQICSQLDVLIVELDGRNVGQARSAGAELLTDAGARWLAFTDADTIVAPQWLGCQLDFNADAVCGTVQVDSWIGHSQTVRDRYEDHYQQIEGHRHVHGANLGVCAKAYLKVGGFLHLPAHEDVQLISSLERIGANIIWTATNVVVTSARKESKCRGGFCDFLKSLSHF